MGTLLAITSLRRDIVLQLCFNVDKPLKTTLKNDQEYSMKNRPTILFLSKKRSSASTRYRCLNYFPFLEKAGFLPRQMNSQGSLLKKLSLLGEIRNADVVVVLRKTFSLPFRIVLGIFSKKIIFDFDDAIFVKSSGKESVLRKRRFKSMVKMVDHTWAGNSYLAQKAEEVCSSVELLPTAVDVSKYKTNEAKTRDHIDIVWIGSSSTRKYLEELIPILEKTAKKHPRIRLKIIADFDLKTTYLTTLAVPWREETEALELGSSHIGIAVMPDDSWSRGKCGLKVLQYMAAALPVVVSDSGVHRDIVKDKKSGFLARENAQWENALEKLINDKPLRESMGRRGNKTVTNHYSYDNTSQQVINTLNTMV